MKTLSFGNLKHIIYLNIPQIMKDKLNLSRSRDRDNTARQVCIYRILSYFNYILLYYNIFISVIYFMALFYAKKH